MRRMIILFFSLLLLSSCSYKPVRHLASDAALIKAGKSTREDVLRYLGEPDNRRTIGPDEEEYLYAETRKGALGSMPLFGKLVDPASQEMVIVTLKGGTVSNCEFRLLRKDDQAWRKDADWEKVE
ncbi:Lipoprotein SmpA/OmlA domain-containing protein [Candidatus Electronema halotolerans]|jgi:hypothetical protein